MITSTGKQSDKELETSFVHFVQMYMLINYHRGIAEVKISLSKAQAGQAFASFFPLSVQLFCGWAREI